MSPLEAAATAIDIHNAASAWNKALLDNSARPSGALVYAAREGRMTADQYARLKAELEQSFEGARNPAGRCCSRAISTAPLRSVGVLHAERESAAPIRMSMSLTPHDMDLIQAKHGAAREIALALGVPPPMRSIAPRCAARHPRRQHVLQLPRGHQYLLAPGVAGGDQISPWRLWFARPWPDKPLFVRE